MVHWYILKNIFNLYIPEKYFKHYNNPLNCSKLIGSYNNFLVNSPVWLSRSLGANICNCFHQFSHLVLIQFKRSLVTLFTWKKSQNLGSDYSVNPIVSGFQKTICHYSTRYRTLKNSVIIYLFITSYYLILT